MTEILHLPTGQIVKSLSKPESKNPFQNLIAQDKILVSFNHKAREGSIQCKPAEPEAVIVKDSEIHVTTLLVKKNFARPASEGVSIKRPKSAQNIKTEVLKASPEKCAKNLIILQKAAKRGKKTEDKKTEEKKEAQTTVKPPAVKATFVAKTQKVKPEPDEEKLKNPEEEREKLKKLKALVMENIKKHKEIRAKTQSDTQSAPKSKVELIEKIEEEAKEIIKKTQLKPYQPTGKWGVDERNFKEKVSKEEEKWKKSSELNKKAYREKVKQEGRARIGLEIIDMYPNLLGNRRKSSEKLEESEKTEKAPKVEVQLWMKQKKLKEKEKQAIEDQIEQEKLRKRIQALKELEMLSRPQRSTKPPTPNKEFMNKLKMKVEKTKSKKMFSEGSSQAKSGSSVGFVVDSEQFNLSPLNKDKIDSSNERMKKKNLKIHSFESGSIKRESREPSNYSENYEDEDFESESQSRSLKNGKAERGQVEKKMKPHERSEKMQVKRPERNQFERQGNNKQMKKEEKPQTLIRNKGPGLKLLKELQDSESYDEEEDENQEEGLQYGEEDSNYEEEDSQNEEEGSQYEEEGSQYEEEDSQFEKDLQYKKQGPQYEEEEEYEEDGENEVGSQFDDDEEGSQYEEESQYEAGSQEEEYEEGSQSEDESQLEEFSQNEDFQPEPPHPKALSKSKPQKKSLTTQSKPSKTPPQAPESLQNPSKALTSYPGNSNLDPTFARFVLHPKADEKSRKPPTAFPDYPVPDLVQISSKPIPDSKERLRTRLADLEKRIDMKLITAKPNPVQLVQDDLDINLYKIPGISNMQETHDLRRVYDEVHIYQAASKIQAVIRGYLARKNLIRVRYGIPSEQQINKDIHSILLKYYPEAYVPQNFGSGFIPESISFGKSAVEVKDKATEMQEVLPLNSFLSPVFKENDEYNLIKVLVKEHFNIESEASVKAQSYETSELYSEEFESASEDVAEIYNRVQAQAAKVPIRLTQKGVESESIQESLEGFNDSARPYMTGSIKESIEGYSKNSKNSNSGSIKESIEGFSKGSKNSQITGSVRESLEGYSPSDSKKSLKNNESIKESFEYSAQYDKFKNSSIKESIEGFSKPEDFSKSSIQESFESKSNSKYSSIKESFEDSKPLPSKTSIKESFEFKPDSSRSSIKEESRSKDSKSASIKDSESIKESFKFKKITESILESIEEHFPGHASESNSSSIAESIKESEKVSDSIQESIPSSHSLHNKDKTPESSSDLQSYKKSFKQDEDYSEEFQSNKVGSKASDYYEEDFESASSAKQSQKLESSGKIIPKLVLRQKSSDPEIRFSHQSSEFSESIKDEINESIHYTDDFESEASERKSRTLSQRSRPVKAKVLSSESASSESKPLSSKRSVHKSLSSSISEEIDLQESASDASLKKPFGESGKQGKILESIGESIKYSDDFEEDSKSSKRPETYSSDFESVSQSTKGLVKGFKLPIKETSSEENESVEVAKTSEKVKDSEIYVEDNSEEFYSESKHSDSYPSPGRFKDQSSEEKIPKLQIPIKSDPESRFSQHKSDLSESIQDDIAESIYSEDFESERSEKKPTLSQRSKSNYHKNSSNFNTKFPEPPLSNSPSKPSSSRSNRKSPELRSSTSSISEDMDMYDSFSKQSVNLESSLRRSASMQDSNKGSKVLESIGESIQYSEDFESESKSFKQTHSYSSDFENVSQSDSKALKGLRVAIKEESPEESCSQEITEGPQGTEGPEKEEGKVEGEVDAYMEYIFNIIKEDALQMLDGPEVNEVVEYVYRHIIDDCLRIVPSKRVFVNNPEYLQRVADRIAASTPDKIDAPKAEDILNSYLGEPLKIEVLELNSELSLNVPDDFRSGFRGMHKALKDSVNALAQDFEFSLFRPVKPKFSKADIQETVSKWLNTKLGCIKPCMTQDEKKQVSKQNDLCIKEVVNQELEMEQSAWLNTEKDEVKLAFEMESSIFSVLCGEIFSLV